MDNLDISEANNTIDTITKKWNVYADEYNQFDTLGLDEIIALVIIELKG